METDIPQNLEPREETLNHHSFVLGSSKPNMKWVAIGLLVMLVVGISAYYAGTTQNKDLSTNVQPQLSPTVTNPLPTELPSANIKTLEAPTYDYTGWKTETIPLYGFAVNLPQTWTIQEVNRQPEPTGEFDPKSGHDCAEYIVQNEDKSMKISIQPVCGFSDGGGSPLPNDAVVVKKIKDGIIARIYEAGAYQYVSAGEVNIEDVYGKRVEMYYGAHLTFGTPPAITSGFVSATYSGALETKESNLKMSDQIIASFVGL